LHTTDFFNWDYDILSATDYYPFGMPMPGRTFNSSGYRFGFNGKENDNEVKGDGNQQDYGMRIYDPRISRFFSVDPITKDFPDLTPYQFASNTPIIAIDFDGLESVWANSLMMRQTFGVTIGAVSKEQVKAEIQRNGKMFLTSTAETGIILTDLFVTKGWLTKACLTYEMGNMLDFMCKSESTNDPVLKKIYQKEAGLSATIILGGALLDVGFSYAMKLGGAVSKGVQGVLKEANFAQTSINKARVFSPEGQQIYSKIVGSPIKTVDNLVDALKNGLVTPKQLPLDYVIVDGQKVILNTRTSVALSEAGIPKSEWYGVNRTGQKITDGITYDDLAKQQTNANELPQTGTQSTPK
jgi:RHS repeat-associated protein